MDHRGIVRVDVDGPEPDQLDPPEARCPVAARRHRHGPQGAMVGDRGRAPQRRLMNNMDRLEAIVARLPEAVRVDIEEWGDHPTFRVNNKNFVFSDQDAKHLSLKLPKDEAAAVVATDPAAEPA